MSKSKTQNSTKPNMIMPTCTIAKSSVVNSNGVMFPRQVLETALTSIERRSRKDKE